MYPDPAHVAATLARLRAAGYDRRVVLPLTCDQGAEEGLGLDPAADPVGTGLYFPDEAAVQQFLKAWYHGPVVGVVQVKLFCLD